jgi:hypothetical protein
MKYTMPKSKALREARRYVGSIIRRSSTDYAFYSPYKFPGGPTTENQACTYPQALSARTSVLVSTALDLMLHEEAEINSYEYVDQAMQNLETRNARAVLDYLLSKIEKRV